MKVAVKTLPDGDKFIEFPDELLAELGWKEGDVLMWDKIDDGSVTIKRVNSLGVSKVSIDRMIAADWTAEQVDALLDVGADIKKLMLNRVVNERIKK
jgi:bifunctional DNA-binding transcriptional regulator/antitoxin component of YhaV-PrlF toxin-antitoxin module